jgi:hypothetical protein
MHPDRTDEPTPDTEHSADWPAIALVVVLGTLFAAIVVLHLTGVVGPGAHP